MTIGEPAIRSEGINLVTGRAAFVDDIALTGMLHARILCSPHSHARIVRIDASRARGLPGVASVVTHEDARRPQAPAAVTPGTAWPNALLEDTVCFMGDPVAVVAAEDPDQALRACEAIVVEYQELEAVLGLDQASTEIAEQQAEPPSRAPAAGQAGVVALLVTERGDLETGIEQAERVFEGLYRAGDLQPFPAVPRVAITWLDEDDHLTVRTSAPSCRHLRATMARLLGISIQRIRLAHPRVAGTSGVGSDIPIESLCGELTLRTGRPVRLVLADSEEMLAARERHPHLIRVQSGVRNGEILALSMRTVLNAGADGRDALSVAWAAGNRALSLYRCAHLRHHATAFRTHLAPIALSSGEGWPPAFFAVESHIDEVALALGLDPLAFRRKNHVREGDTPLPITEGRHPQLAEASPLRSVGLAAAIEQGARQAGWPGEQHGYPDNSVLRRGMGMATTMSTSGPAAIEMGVATVRMNSDGSVDLQVDTGDLPPGTDLVLCQIAAATLKIPVDRVFLNLRDTEDAALDADPFIFSTFHSKGRAVEKAARAVLVQIVGSAARALAVAETSLLVEGGSVRAPDGRCLSFQAIRDISLWQQGQPRLAATESYTAWDRPPAFAAVFAEVEVDTLTGGVRVLRLIQAVDCGTVINPLIVQARIEGSVVWGLTMTVSDRAARPGVSPHGVVGLARTTDLPGVVTILVPRSDPSGPYGTKTLADIPLNAIAPAIANAVAHAVGVRLRELPIGPEQVLLGLEDRRRRQAPPTEN